MPAEKKSLEEVKMSLAGYKGHLQCGDTYNLRRNVNKSFILVKNYKEEEEEYEKDY